MSEIENTAPIISPLPFALPFQLADFGTASAIEKIFAAPI